MTCYGDFFHFGAVSVIVSFVCHFLLGTNFISNITSAEINDCWFQVSVHYIGKLKKNEEIFDSNIGRRPFKFRLGILIICLLLKPILSSVKWS